MPRTKQVRKKSSIAKQLKSKPPTNQIPLTNLKESATTIISREYTSSEHLLQEFNNYYNNRIKEHQEGYNKACQMVKEMFSNILKKLPDPIKLSTINGNVDESSLSILSLVEDQNEDPNTFTTAKTRSLRAKHLESNYFKKPNTPRIGTSRSSSRKRSVSVSATPANTSNCFKTPLMSSRKLLSSGMTIAPKISDRPMCVLRRPVQGEMAISMSGSPLMVGAFSTEEIPTVNVPLQDGRIISIVPEEGAAPPDIAIFDETTKKYLKTLRAHLEILAPNSP